MTTYFKAQWNKEDYCSNCDQNFLNHTNGVCPGQPVQQRNVPMANEKKHARILFKNLPGGRSRLVAEGEISSVGISRADMKDVRRTFSFYTEDKNGKEMYVSVELTTEAIKRMFNTWQEIENNPTGWTNHNKPASEVNHVTDERLLNTRAWAQARRGSLSGAEVIIAAIDEALAARASKLQRSDNLTDILYGRNESTET